MNSERSERRRRARAGVTMVELVISTVVIAVGLAGVLMVIDTTTRHSADPMLQQQAVAIAEAYLEEALLKSYLDPDGGGICPAPEASRSLYDNICDYDGLDDSPPRDQGGAAFPDLAAYRVRVAVDQAASLAGFVGSAVVLRVDVRVSHPAGLDLSVSGYRTNY